MARRSIPLDAGSSRCTSAGPVRRPQRGGIVPLALPAMAPRSPPSGFFSRVEDDALEPGEVQQAADIGGDEGGRHACFYRHQGELIYEPSCLCKIPLISFSCSSSFVF